MFTIFAILATLFTAQAGLPDSAALSRFPGLSNFLENYVAEQQRRFVFLIDYSK